MIDWYLSQNWGQVNVTITTRFRTGFSNFSFRFALYYTSHTYFYKTNTMRQCNSSFWPHLLFEFDCCILLCAKQLLKVDFGFIIYAFDNLSPTNHTSRCVKETLKILLELCFMLQCLQLLTFLRYFLPRKFILSIIWLLPELVFEKFSPNVRSELVELNIVVNMTE